MPEYAPTVRGLAMMTGPRRGRHWRDDVVAENAVVPPRVRRPSEIAIADPGLSPPPLVPRWILHLLKTLSRPNDEIGSSPWNFKFLLNADDARGEESVLFADVVGPSTPAWSQHTTVPIATDCRSGGTGRCGPSTPMQASGNDGSG